MRREMEGEQMDEKILKELDGVYLDVVHAIATALPRYIAAEWTTQDVISLLQKYHPEQIVADWLIAELITAEKEAKDERDDEQ